MKKVLSIIFTAMLALGASAQNTHDIVIWHGTKSQTIQAVDSITFVKSKEKATYIDGTQRKVGHLQYWGKKS